MSSWSTTQRLLPWLLGALLGCVLASAPRLAAGAKQRGTLAPLTSPAERALSGGLVVLRAPRSLMLRLPAGHFQMGSQPLDVLQAILSCTRAGGGLTCEQALFADEAPAHRVSLSSFWLDRTEVTVAEYRRCAQLKRCRPAPYERGAQRFNRGHFPVSFVNHGDAKAYCKYRGARLPTEAEWERAARGRSRRTYPWGMLYNSHVSNHGRLSPLEALRADASDGHLELAPVGSYPAGRTPEGLLDLAGNVSEWVSDRYGPYSELPQTNPQGPPVHSGTGNVRGGHYRNASPWLRSTKRQAADLNLRVPFIGFRCAKSATPGRPPPQRSGQSGSVKC